MWGQGPDGAPGRRQACSPLLVSVRVSLSPLLCSPFSTQGPLGENRRSAEDGLLCSWPHAHCFPPSSTLKLTLNNLG